MIAIIDLSTTCILVERNYVVTRLGAGSSSVGVTIDYISVISLIKRSLIAAVTGVERRVHDLIARHRARVGAVCAIGGVPIRAAKACQSCGVQISRIEVSI